MLSKLLPTILAVLVGFAPFCFGAESASTAPVRLSTWYWLNSIEREKWEDDFKLMAETGFTHVILCWGLDAAAVLPQKENTRRALDLCQKYGLKGYLLVWHPSYNKLPRQADFMQVDNEGNRLFTFNLFHRQWRATQWKNYLQGVAGEYHDHPALAGYAFDDSFSTGAVGSLMGDKISKRGDFVSYSPYDFVQFRIWLRKKYPALTDLNKAWGIEYAAWEQVGPPREITARNTIAWQDWCAARTDWLVDWAGDTVGFIRAVDPSPQHEIILEDGDYVLGKERKSARSSRPVKCDDLTGLVFGRVARPFDTVAAYASFSWNYRDSFKQATNRTQTIIRQLREQVGGDKEMMFAFWTADADLRKAPLLLPEDNQVLSVIHLAHKLGVRHVDCYGFRIGDWRVTDEEWAAYRSDAVDYPLTKTFDGRFLCDRPDLLDGLREGLKGKPTR